VLSRVLAANRDPGLPPPIADALVSIRRDEGGHVFIARTLAVELGMDPGAMRCIDLETRRAFDHVLHAYEGAFASIDVDPDALRRRVRRDGR
jgi:hypothetical protein